MDVLTFHLLYRIKYFRYNNLLVYLNKIYIIAEELL
jgi:hypothetical protein